MGDKKLNLERVLRDASAYNRLYGGFLGGIATMIIYGVIDSVGIETNNIPPIITLSSVIVGFGLGAKYIGDYHNREYYNKNKD